MNEHMPGYLPDGDPGVFGTWREATAYAYELAKQLREEGYRIVGTSHMRAPLVDMAETIYKGETESHERLVSIGAVACQDPNGDCDYCEYETEGMWGGERKIGD